MKILQTACFTLLFFVCPVSIFADHYSLLPPQIADLSPKSDRINQSNWRNVVKELHKPGGIIGLPTPQRTKGGALHLSLREAILLSLRNNPNIQSADIGRVIDKFSLVVAHNAFELQYSAGGTGNLAIGSPSSYVGNVGATLKNKIGTQFGVGYTNTYLVNGGNGPGVVNFSITQPLLRGFGAEVNLIPWFNALDAENQARLAFKGTIMTQVTSIVTGYYQLVQDYQNIAIQEHTLASNAKMVKESELKLKVGQLARNDVTQQKAAYQTTKLSLLTQRSALILDYQTFLAALGFKASAKVDIDKDIVFEKIKVPTLSQAIQLAIKGNVQYQTQLIAIRAAQRAIIAAKDAARWQLDATANFSYSGKSQTTVAEGTTTNGIPALQPFFLQNSPSVLLTFNVPINNVAQKQAILNARIQLEQAKLALEGQRLTLVRQITNSIQQIHNQILTVKSAEEQVKLQKENLAAVQIKYRYGRTTTFEMNQIQDQLLAQEMMLVSNKVQLVNQITALNQDLGLTLKQWGITLRY